MRYLGKRKSGKARYVQCQHIKDYLEKFGRSALDYIRCADCNTRWNFVPWPKQLVILYGVRRENGVWSDVQITWDGNFYPRSGGKLALPGEA